MKIMTVFLAAGALALTTISCKNGEQKQTGEPMINKGSAEPGIQKASWDGINLKINLKLLV